MELLFQSGETIQWSENTCTDKNSFASMLMPLLGISHSWQTEPGRNLEHRWDLDQMNNLELESYSNDPFKMLLFTENLNWNKVS